MAQTCLPSVLGEGEAVVAFVAADGLVAVGERLLPQLLAVGADGHQHQVVAFGRGQEDAVAPNDRRRAGRARQRQPPGDVLGLAPLERQVRSRR